MNKKDYIGVSLAKHLQEKGFDGECEYGFVDGEVVLKEFWETVDGEWGSCRDIKFPNDECYSCSKLEKDEICCQIHSYKIYSYYQILTELSKELFGDDNYSNGGLIEPKYYHSTVILQMLQQNKPQEEVDEYIKSNLKDKWK